MAYMVLSTLATCEVRVFEIYYHLSLQHSIANIRYSTDLNYHSDNQDSLVTVALRLVDTSDIITVCYEPGPSTISIESNRVSHDLLAAAATIPQFVPASNFNPDLPGCGVVKKVAPAKF